MINIINRRCIVFPLYLVSSFCINSGAALSIAVNVEHIRVEFSTTANIRDKSRSSSSFVSYKSRQRIPGVDPNVKFHYRQRSSIGAGGEEAGIGSTDIHGYLRGFTLHPHNVYARIYPRTVSRGCASFDDKCRRISRFRTLDASSVSSSSARQYVTRDIYRRGIFASGLRAREKEKYAGENRKIGEGEISSTA